MTADKKARRRFLDEMGDLLGHPWSALPSPDAARADDIRAHPAEFTSG